MKEKNLQEKIIKIFYLFVKLWQNRNRRIIASKKGMTESE